MTVVHNSPHPLAMEVVIPANTEIAKKFGEVRIEDWEDRVAGLTWTEQYVRSVPSTRAYEESVWDAKTGTVSSLHAVVRCHSTATGELILLHDDWLPKSL
jgi:hypothetical protein